MSFEAACDIAARLRAMGFEGATVVDQYAAAPTTADLAAAKLAVEYTVTFHSRFFCGTNEQGQILGSRDRKEAVQMSQPAAIEIQRRLKRMGFRDAAVQSCSSAFVDVSKELKTIWHEDAAKK
jgi:hypothetical protein